MKTCRSGPPEAQEGGLVLLRLSGEKKGKRAPVEKYPKARTRRTTLKGVVEGQDHTQEGVRFEEERQAVTVGRENAPFCSPIVPQQNRWIPVSGRRK